MAQETKRKERFSRTFWCLWTPALSQKLSLSPGKWPVLSVSFQKREKSRGILLTSLSKFWGAQLGTTCTDQWTLSIRYHGWLSLDVSSGAHLPILRAPKAFESQHTAGTQKTQGGRGRWEGRELALIVAKVKRWPLPVVSTMSCL